MEQFVHKLPLLAAMHNVHPMDISLLFLNHVGVILTALMTAFAEEIRLPAAHDKAVYMSVYPKSEKCSHVHTVELRNHCHMDVSEPDSSQIIEESPKTAAISALGSNRFVNAVDYGMQDCTDQRVPPWSCQLVHVTVDAFKRGFAAVLTSYLGCVEHINDLLKQRAFLGALLFFLAVFIGGPLIYAGAMLAARMLAHYATPALIRSSSCCRSLDHGLNIVRSVLCAAVLLISMAGLWADLAGSLVQTELYVEMREKEADALSRNAQKVHQNTLWWQLPCGLLSVMIACVVGDYIAAATQTAPKLERWMPGVDWPTASSNAIALVLGHIFLTLEAMVVKPSTRASLEQIHASAGGALSGYTGFAEVVCLHALSGRWRPALMNWLVNVGIAAIFCLLIFLTSDAAHVGVMAYMA